MPLSLFPRSPPSALLPPLTLMVMAAPIMLGVAAPQIRYHEVLIANERRSIDVDPSATKGTSPGTSPPGGGGATSGAEAGEARSADLQYVYDDVYRFDVALSAIAGGGMMGSRIILAADTTKSRTFWKDHGVLRGPAVSEPHCGTLAQQYSAAARSGGGLGGFGVAPDFGIGCAPDIAWAMSETGRRIKALKEQDAQSGQVSRDIVFVVYSGHGDAQNLHIPAWKAQIAPTLPDGAGEDLPDLERLGEVGYLSGHVLVGLAERFLADDGAADMIVIVADTCDGGGVDAASRSVDDRRNRQFEAIGRRRAAKIAIFSSAVQIEELAKVHTGPVVHTVLSGLLGAAERNDDGQVTLAELGAFFQANLQIGGMEEGFVGKYQFGANGLGEVLSSLFDGSTLKPRVGDPHLTAVRVKLPDMSRSLFGTPPPRAIRAVITDPDGGALIEANLQSAVGDEWMDIAIPLRQGAGYDVYWITDVGQVWRKRRQQAQAPEVQSDTKALLLEGGEAVEPEEAVALYLGTTAMFSAKRRGLFSRVRGLEQVPGPTWVVSGNLGWGQVGSPPWGWPSDDKGLSPSHQEIICDVYFMDAGRDDCEMLINRGSLYELRQPWLSPFQVTLRYYPRFEYSIFASDNNEWLRHFFVESGPGVMVGPVPVQLVMSRVSIPYVTGGVGLRLLLNSKAEILLSAGGGPALFHASAYFPSDQHRNGLPLSVLMAQGYASPRVCLWPGGLDSPRGQGLSGWRPAIELGATARVLGYRYQEDAGDELERRRALLWQASGGVAWRL